MRPAVRRRPRLAPLVVDDELLLDAEHDVAVEVVGALLEQVGDQRLVARHVDQEVHVRRAEVADVGSRDQVADRAVHRDRVAERRDGAHAVAAVLAGRVLGAQPGLVDVGVLRLVEPVVVGLPQVEHRARHRGAVEVGHGAVQHERRAGQALRHVLAVAELGRALDVERARARWPASPAGRTGGSSGRRASTARARRR